MGRVSAYLQITKHDFRYRKEVKHFVDEAMIHVYKPTIFDDEFDEDNILSFYMSWFDRFESLIKENDLWDEFDEKDVILNRAEKEKMWKEGIERESKEIDYIYGALHMYDIKRATAVYEMAQRKYKEYADKDWGKTPIVVKINRTTGELIRYRLEEATPESLLEDWLVAITCKV